MEIPRDVLLAGARAYWLHLGQSPERADELAANWVDSNGDCVVIMVAAIEAWENRPHPWGEWPDTDATRQAALQPTRERVADETAEAIAVWAEDNLSHGEGIAHMIRHGDWRPDDRDQ